MSRISVITFNRNNKVEASQVNIDLRKYGKKLEDLPDSLVIEARKNKSIVCVKTFFKKTDKFHGIKSVKKK